MEYIVVTLLAVSLTAFIVYRISNKFFGLNLRLKPIILCAACAILISIVLPRIIVSFAGLIGTMGVMAVFAIIFAYFIAYYDDLATEEMEKETERLSIAIAKDKGQAENELAELVLSTDEDEMRLFTPAFEQNTRADERSLSACAATVEPEAEMNITQNVLNSNKKHEESLKQLDEAVCSTPQSSQDAEADERSLSAATIEPDAKIINILQNDSVSAEGIKSSSYQIDEFIGDNTMEEDMSANLTLDDLMDLGFKYKEQHDFDKALDVFRQALRLYSNSDAAPYLAIEIGTLLKNKGAYDAAIEAFAEGRNLARLQGNDMIEQEVIAIIAYLRIIKNVLLENMAGLVPFNSIPPHLLNTIDKEFADWRKLEQN